MVVSDKVQHDHVVASNADFMARRCAGICAWRMAANRRRIASAGRYQRIIS